MYHEGLKKRYFGENQLFSHFSTRCRALPYFTETLGLPRLAGLKVWGEA